MSHTTIRDMSRTRSPTPWRVLSAGLFVSILSTGCPVDLPSPLVPPDCQVDDNLPPTMIDQSFDIPFNESTTLVLAMFDPDQQPGPLAASIVSLPSHGTVIAANSTLVYTPDEEYIGDDSFTVCADDGELVSATANVFLHVLAPPPPGVVSLMEPADLSFARPTTQTLRWTAAVGATSYSLRLGTVVPPPTIADVAATEWQGAPLLESQRYYWQIVSKNAGSSVEGAVWSFTTAPLSGEVHASGSAALGGCAGAVLPNENAGFVKVACGRYFNMGLKVDGSVHVWADFLDHALEPPPDNRRFVAIAAGDNHCVALAEDGSVVTWGRNSNASGGVAGSHSDFIAISANGGHSLALRSDGSIAIWGDQSELPTPNTGFVAIAAGADHNLALKADGSLVAWGSNDKGQCDIPTPNSGFTAISAGGRYSAALRSDTTIAMWGDNSFRQLEVTPPNTGFVAVAAGWSQCMALRSDSSLAGWGGLGWSAGSPRPVLPRENFGFIAISTGACQYAAIRVPGWTPSASAPIPNQ